MKKMKLLATALLVTTLLAACGKKTTTPSSSSSSTSSQTTETSTVASTSPATTETPSNTENPSSFAFTKMDIEAISQGDYSSLVGKWVSEEGYFYTFNVLGLVGDSKIEQPSRINEGVLETGVRYGGGYGYALVMIPAGVPIPRAYYQDYDHSDIHRDRLYGTQSAFNNIDQEEVYYRVPPQTNIESNPLTTDDTGVRLESGQSTIDYANAILGPLNWQVIESNYNRTESIPFELLQGENGWLYRVYRNGVILSQTKDVIIYVP